MKTDENSILWQCPVKIEPWYGIFDATIEKSGCLQFSLLKKRVSGSEDCLYNNIFTPQVKYQAIFSYYSSAVHSLLRKRIVFHDYLKIRYHRMDLL